MLDIEYVRRMNIRREAQTIGIIIDLLKYFQWSNLLGLQLVVLMKWKTVFYQDNGGDNWQKPCTFQ